MDLDVAATKHRFEETIAEPLDQSVPEAALSTIKIANASLARNIRKVTLKRGEDPRKFRLVAFGGAGPLHAANVAREMDIEEVIVPRDPGVFSAKGLLVAPIRLDESRSYRGREPDEGLLREQFEELESKLFSRIRDQGLAEERATLDYKADVRYVGQSYELTVPVPNPTSNDGMLEDIREEFNDRHERIYGYARADEPFEIVILRANARIPTSALEREGSTSDRDAHRGTREVYFERTGFTETEIYERPLPHATSVEGPAILEETVSTTVVPPESTAKISGQGYITLSL
jgi:N-methylhydantoinase A